MRHIGDYDDAGSLVKRLVDGLPSGGYLVLDDGTDVVDKAAVEAAQGPYNHRDAIPYHPRSSGQIAGFFPAWTWWSRAWCRVPAGAPAPADLSGGLPAEVDAFGGVGRKP